MKHLFLGVLMILLGSAAVADESSAFDMASDAFRAGQDVRVTRGGIDDLFAAGETVSVPVDIAGTAHLAGREVSVPGDIGGDALAMGMEVQLTGAVAGDATVMGYEVAVGPVGGDLRATGSEVVLSGPVTGYAMLAGETVEIDGEIAGDLMLAAEDVAFGAAARVGGTLVVYEEDPGTLDIPASVASADQIERREIEAWDRDMHDYRPSVGGMIGRFLLGVVVLAGLAALIASVIPDHLAIMRRRVLDKPFGTLAIGFLALSAIIGSAVVFAMTLIGFLFSPAMVILAVVAGFAGYVVGVYALGVGLMLAVGRPDPSLILDKVIAAAVGAVAAGLIALIPLLGWLVVLALTLAGLGAITDRLLRPAFFVDRV